MADIKVKDLAVHNISGFDLFKDSESFMIEISDESDQVVGAFSDPASAITGRSVTIMLIQW
jgi:hypothetical protein